MKNKLLILGCAMCLMGPVFAADDDDHTPLGKQMEIFNDAYKAFRKETDPVKGAEQVREAQQAVLKGMGELPSMLTKMPDGRDKQMAAARFRKMMGHLFVTLSEVEEAFLAGKTDEVARLVETLKEMKKAGHDKFMEE
jgi:soluble cytochrome b562